jgi:hypothetical protein
VWNGRCSVLDLCECEPSCLGLFKGKKSTSHLQCSNFKAS